MDKSEKFRFSIQFNLSLEEHRIALEKLNKIKNGDKSEFCISCILGKPDENQELKQIIRSTIKECLNDTRMSDMPKEIGVNKEEEEIEIMDSVLDFMTLFA